MPKTKYPEDCQCNRCVGACSHNPGWFTPRQAEKVAKLLGLTLKEFFDKYLGVNWWEKEEGSYEKDIFVLAPAITTMEAGTEYPADPRGKCVFFKDGKCQIHDAKPHECKAYTHTDTREDVHVRHRAVADKWATEKNQKQIVKLLGREPKSENFSLLDLYGIGSMWS